MKLAKSLKVRGVIIPAGTELEFSNEGFATIAGLKIAKDAIPEAAFESHSQRRDKGSKATLRKSIRLGSELIPAGTELCFSAEGMTSYNGKEISIYQIPSVAFESYDGSAAKLKKAVRIGAEIIPAGTELYFSTEGLASYNGKEISIYQIPSVAFESYEGVNNKVDPDKSWKDFDKVEPGDMGFDANGAPVRFLGKAIGRAGYDALVGQFGDTTGKTFEEITAGMDEDEIKDAEFVAYSANDDTVTVSLYGAEYAAATESDGGKVLDIEEVEPGDAAIDWDGKPCVVIAKGQGLTWYKKMLQAVKCEDCLKEIRESLGVDDDDKMNNTWFVLVTNDNNEKNLSHYGEGGVKVFKSEEE